MMGISNRVYRYAFVGLVLFVIGALVFAFCTTETNERLDSPLAFQSQTVSGCAVIGQDEATGALEVGCASPELLRLYVDAEVYADGELIASETVETFVFAAGEPAGPISMTLGLEGVDSGALYIRARWASSPWDTGIVGGVEKDGIPLQLDERGFALFESSIQYLPVIVVIE